MWAVRCFSVDEVDERMRNLQTFLYEKLVDVCPIGWTRELYLAFSPSQICPVQGRRKGSHYLLESARHPRDRNMVERLYVFWSSIEEKHRWQRRFWEGYCVPLLCIIIMRWAKVNAVLKTHLSMSGGSATGLVRSQRRRCRCQNDRGCSFVDNLFLCMMNKYWQIYSSCTLFDG